MRPHLGCIFAGDALEETLAATDAAHRLPETAVSFRCERILQQEASLANRLVAQQSASGPV